MAARKAFSKPAAFDVLIEGLTLKNELTAERLRQVVRYDPATGLFVHARSAGKAIEGAQAGTANATDGYLRMVIDGRRYLLHRLAWLYVHGRWPADQIDHINRNPSDNRISNLRECTNAQNCWNSGLHGRNTSGHRGVSRHEHLWRATISANGQRVHLGRFATPEQAAAAYEKAARDLHRITPC